MSSEEAQWAAEVAEVDRFLKQPRFQYTKRPYTAEDVVKLRGSLPHTPASDFTAKKLYGMCRKRFADREFTHTFGALDPVQVRTKPRV